MESSSHSHTQSADSALFPVLSSVAVTLFLFFIDEGYYNFNWMADLGNWVAFAIYFTAILVVQVALRALVFRKVTGLLGDGVAFVAGVALALFLLIGFVFN